MFIALLLFELVCIALLCENVLFFNLSVEFCRKWGIREPRQGNQVADWQQQ